MRYFALATDYDGTLAQSGRVEVNTIQAIKRVKSTGRRILLVTGRRLDDLMRAFPEFDLFDYIVAENGAVLYHPASQRTELMAKPIPDNFVQKLKEFAVDPLEVGKAIVATHISEKEKVLNAIQQLGLEVQFVFNGDAVMVLPAGTNKASGTEHALEKMGLSFHEVVAVGDSENDHSLLNHSECPVAVNNAIDSIKGISVHVTRGNFGTGVAELARDLVENDLEYLAPKLTHNHIELGRNLDDTTVWLHAYGRNLLIAGPSGSGKSTFAAGFIERLLSKDYQICIIDPEGDYGTMSGIVAIGSPSRIPSSSEIIGILEDPKVNISVNLLGVPLLDRPEYLSHLLPGLQAMRTRTGRPHWIVIDEAHHLLPTTWGPASLSLPQKLGETILLTVHPDQLAPSILQLVDAVVAVGSNPNETLASFSRASGKSYSAPIPNHAVRDEVTAWLLYSNQEPFTIKGIPGRAERLRHLRKYAEGNLGKHSFYFRGPEKKLNLKAQNLAIFIQISEGLDEMTWGHHLKHGDYSRWFRLQIKDPHLADETERIERRSDLGIGEARRLVCELISARYTM